MECTRQAPAPYHNRRSNESQGFDRNLIKHRLTSQAQEEIHFTALMVLPSNIEHHQLAMEKRINLRE